MGFSKLGLSPELLRALTDLRFTTPTAIQKDAIPPAIEGRDVLACSMTGSGKTAAFGLPMLQRLQNKPRGTTRALILTPTRELAAQIDEHLKQMAKHTGLTVAAVYGGVSMGAQRHALARGVDIVVATPGRLLDHMENNNAKFNGVEILALDEADRMLDMGFLPDIKRILQRLPKERQTLFFSATMPSEIVRLSKEMLRNPHTVQVERKAAPATGVTQTVYPVPQHLKSALLVELIEQLKMDSVLVFTRTKHRADRLSTLLSGKGINNARIHGDRTQSQRQQALKGFKAGRYSVLVATDVAARGIDVEALSHVINFDVPEQSEDYIHRVGRTARASAKGDAFTFVASQEEGDLRNIERAINQKLPRVVLPDFDYKKAAPERQPGQGNGEGGGRFQGKRPRPWEQRNDRGGSGGDRQRGSSERGGFRGGNNGNRYNSGNTGGTGGQVARKFDNRNDRGERNFNSPAQPRNDDRRSPGARPHADSSHAGGNSSPRGRGTRPWEQRSERSNSYSR
jgi:ATP-dependent RNA helicase RhlE